MEDHAGKRGGRQKGGGSLGREKEKDQEEREIGMVKEKKIYFFCCCCQPVWAQDPGGAAPRALQGSGQLPVCACSPAGRASCLAPPAVMPISLSLHVRH